MQEYSRKISVVGGLIILFTALFGVLGGFAVLFPQVLDQLQKNLQRSLEIRDDQFNGVVQQAWLDSFILASQPLLGDVVKTLDAGPPTVMERAQVQNVADSAFQSGFSAVVFRDKMGREIARNGTFVLNPDLDVVVRTPTPSHLLWKNGFILHTHMDILVRGKTVGTLDTEHPLWQLSKVNEQAYQGSTTDFAICAPATKTTMHCFPFRSTEGKVLLNLPDRIDGQRIPMSYALANETGLIHARDYRGQDVIAAYQPIGGLGLGSVLKIDAGELYEPISSKFKVLLVLLLVLVSAGILVLYKQVYPLVRRMMDEIEERKRAYTQLHDSEERYRTLIEGMAEGVVLQDADGVVLTCNQSAENILGLTREQMSGRSAVDPRWGQIREDGSAFPGQDNPALVALRTGQLQSNIIMGIHRPDGTLVWIAIHAQPLYKPAESRPYAVIVTFNDITDRKIAAQKMQQFKIALETTVEGFCIIDERGIVQEVNQALARLVGYPVEELYGLDAVLLEADQSPEKAQEHFSRVAAQGWDVFEAQLRRKDGSRIEVEITASYMAESKQFVSFIHDISRQKEDQRKIRLLTQLYAALSQTNHALIECKDEGSLFDSACRIVVEYGGMKMAWIGKVDESGQLIKPVAKYGEGTDYLDGIRINTDADDPYGKGPTAITFRENHEVIVNDFGGSPMTAAYHERAKPYGWGAGATFPIQRSGQPYAVFTLYHEKKHSFTEEMIGLMSEMVVNMGHGLDRFDLEADKRKAEAAMQLAAAIYESTAEAVMVTDENNLIVDVNPAFTNITGYTLDEVRGRNPSLFRSGRHSKQFYDELWQSIREYGTWQGEIWDRRKDGELQAKWLSISVIRHPDGSIYRHVAEFSDITEKKRTDELIWTQANFDALTNLPNRRLLADRIQQAIAASERNGQYGAVIELDLDHFKQLNDTVGHSSGDELLFQVAQRLRSSVREEDTVARLGGDEFILLLNELSNDPNEAAAQAEQVAEKIRVHLSNPYQLGKIDYLTTPSIGIVLFRGHEISQETLLSHVDTAMYQAKANGRNTICFFDAKMQQALEQRGQLERALRVALSRDELLLYYQLQVDNHGRPLGAEALLRWRHPELGMVSPAQFIPLAEETGLILPIGHWVLETACAQLARWQNDERLNSLSIAINVSARQFRESAFVEDVRTVLQKFAVRPATLKLELTESLVLENVEDAISKMRELKAMGIKFSMDDFGTGYSSLSYLSRLPIDQLKIDQSFVRNITVDQNDAAIAQTIISMAHSLGMEVLAEGVETEEQREFLELRGCIAYQGYLFARPLPIAELEQKLR